MRYEEYAICCLVVCCLSLTNSIFRLFLNDVIIRLHKVCHKYIEIYAQCSPACHPRIRRAFEEGGHMEENKIPGETQITKFLQISMGLPSAISHRLLGNIYGSSSRIAVVIRYICEQRYKCKTQKEAQKGRVPSAGILACVWWLGYRYMLPNPLRTRLFKL